MVRRLYVGAMHVYTLVYNDEPFTFTRACFTRTRCLESSSNENTTVDGAEGTPWYQKVTFAEGSARLRWGPL